MVFIGYRLSLAKLSQWWLTRHQFDLRLLNQRNRLGIVSVSDLVRQGRLRCFGHVERKDVDDRVSSCRNMAVSGERGRGRGAKTWNECVTDDMRQLRLRQEDAQDRVVWRNGILGSRPTHATVEIQTLNR
jgi:hypothetical protein